MQGEMGGLNIIVCAILLVLVDGWVFISVKGKNGGGRMGEDVVKK